MLRHRKEGLMYTVNLSKKGLCLLFIVVITIFVISGCALTQKIYYGNLRKGHIDEVTDSSVIVILGQMTGAQVGEELNVYETTIISRIKQPPLYKSAATGRIRITKIIDDYHSMAIIISGQVRKNQWTSRKTINKQ